MNAFVVFCLILFFYFFPTILAVSRSHLNTAAIFMLNFLLGWTCLGWIIAVIWACTSNVNHSGSAGVARAKFSKTINAGLSVLLVICIVEAAIAYSHYKETDTQKRTSLPLDSSTRIESSTKATHINPVSNANTDEASSVTTAPENSKCLSDGQTVTLRGVASATKSETADEFQGEYFVLTVDAPQCMTINEIGSDGPREVRLSTFKVIGDPPPLGVPLELTGSLRLLDSVHFPSGEAEIRVVSGRRIPADSSLP